MNKTVTVSIPHHLTQEEAGHRIESGVADARKSFGMQMSAFQEKWTGNRLDFSFTVMGQAITGRADVLPETVNLAVDVPWLWAAFAGKFVPQIKERATKLLS